MCVTACVIMWCVGRVYDRGSRALTVWGRARLSLVKSGSPIVEWVRAR